MYVRLHHPDVLLLMQMYGCQCCSFSELPTAVRTLQKRLDELQAHADRNETEQEADLRTTTLKGHDCWVLALEPASASSRGGVGDPKRWGWGQARMKVSMALVRGEVTHKASSGILCSTSLLRSLEACTLV